MPAEMRRIAVRSLEPDPDNAGVGMWNRFFVLFTAWPVGCAVFLFLQEDFYEKVNTHAHRRGRDGRACNGPELSEIF